RKLNIRPAGLDPDLSDDAPRGIPHPLIFLVAERENGGHGDAVARMDAHWIDVLDRADHDEVVRDVAHDFELEFLPADDGLLDQGFGDRAELEAAFGQVVKFLGGVGYAAAHAAKRERRANHEREAKRAREFEGLGKRTREAALRDIEANRAHRVLEQ